MEDGYRLGDIARITGGALVGDPDLRITALLIDSRKPVPAEGGLFIALRGAHHDGHAHIHELLSKGLRAVMVDRKGADAVKGCAAVVVDDTLQALQQLAAWHRKRYTYPVIGITGSNGKTVVKEWLDRALGTEEFIVRSPGSWNSQVGVPLSVWEMRAEHTLGIFEAGISQPGEMERLAAIIAPTIGIFTNIGPAHGEHFPGGDPQKAAEKAKLFRTAQVVVHCADQALVHAALLDARMPEQDVIGWSRKGTAYLRVLREEVGATHTDLLVEVAGAQHRLTLPFTDAASTENALHIITLLFHLGHGAAWIDGRLSALEPVSMRLRMVSGTNDSVLLDDTYSNDLGSLRIALDHLVRMGGKRERVVVISDILESASDAGALYDAMAALIKGADVRRVYGVGTGLAQHAAMFTMPARFFATTEELLNAVPPDALAGCAVLVKGARAFGLERAVERWQQLTHGTELRIDLEALRHNLNHYRALVGPEVKVMAMVKAFGYGSGAVELARLFEHERVHYLGVAYADEGIELRRHGIRMPVLVMNPEPVPLDVLHRFQLETEVYDLTTLVAAIRFAEHTPGLPPVHIKLDTGMHRLGFTAQEVPALLDALRGVGALRIGSILSHLAASEDPAHDAFTREQLASFNALCDRIGSVLGYRPMRHIANSAATTRFKGSRSDMVRLGIGLHGIGANAAETVQLRPVSTLRTVIAQVKVIPPGDSVSYGRRFVAERPTPIAVLPIGYADGLSRRLGSGVGHAWIDGKRAPFVGSICMDMCMVDVSGIRCAAGDEAVLFGADHPVQEYADALGTIPYEALTSISPRVRRVYIHDR